MISKKMIENICASALEIVDTLKCLDADNAALYAYDTSLLAKEK